MRNKISYFFILLKEKHENLNIVYAKFLTANQIVVYYRHATGDYSYSVII